MKYTVELIPKKSVMNDILGYWTASGRTDNTADGVFIFSDADEFGHRDGVIEIKKGDKYYLYNASDFYRVKVTCQA